MAQDLPRSSSREQPMCHWLIRGKARGSLRAGSGDRDGRVANRERTAFPPSYRAPDFGLALELEQRARARESTASSIAGVSFPVFVFCWLTW